VREMEETYDLAVPLDVESSGFLVDWLEGFTLCNMESCDLIVPLGVESLVSCEVGCKVIYLVFLMVWRRIKDFSLYQILSWLSWYCCLGVNNFRLISVMGLCCKWR
jgi:hypothetical protein